MEEEHEQMVENVFSNASECESWQSTNCYQCDKYEQESDEEENAGCPMAFHIDLGFVTGEIPARILTQLGYKNGDLPNCKHIIKE